MYLLDTDICIYLIKKQPEYLLKKFNRQKAGKIGISSVSVAELEYGVAKSTFPGKNRIALLEFLSELEIIPFSDQDTEAYGLVRSWLEKKGIPIGPYDLQIAAQCLSRGYVLVTNNSRELKRVPDLKTENWTQAPGQV